MIKRIDGVDDSAIHGFSYANKDGHIEQVVFDYHMVHLQYASEDDSILSTIYMSDIPNLIKALQAAYDYKQGK